MLQASIIIDSKRKTKKGFSVKAQIYCTIEQISQYIPLNIYQASKTLISHEAQLELVKLHMRIEPIRDLPLSEAWPLLHQESDLEILARKHKLSKRNAEIPFIPFAEKMILEREVQKMATQAFKDAIREVRAFSGEDLGMNDITYRWVKAYRLHKLQKGTKEGGISYYLRTIRQIYNEAIREDIGVIDTKPFKGMIKTSASAEHSMKNWSLEDLGNLRSFDHPNATDKAKKNQKKAIDMFFFQLAIGGHDLIDIAAFTWDNIQDGRLVFKRYKNRNKASGGQTVNVMLNTYAQKIIKTYGDSESKQIFPFWGDPFKGTFKYRLQYDTLKRISAEMKVKTPFSTKTPRYIFRSLAGELLVHDIIIESIQGHKPTSISRGYQTHISPSVQDGEHEKIWKKITSSF